MPPRLASLIAALSLASACGGREPPADDASPSDVADAVDAPLSDIADASAERDSPDRTLPDVTMTAPDRAEPECDPSAHIDCFFAIACGGGMVQRSAHAPFPCCTAERCATAYTSDVCWVQHATCPSGACDARRLACNQPNLYARFTRGGEVDLTLFCAGGGRRAGDRCATDDQCAPQVAGAAGRLRCDVDAGACVSAPRPTTPTWSECVWDDDCAEGDLCDCARVAGGVEARRCLHASEVDAGASD